jgi:ergothioneine biosynthesis protein EgtB
MSVIHEVPTDTGERGENAAAPQETLSWRYREVRRATESLAASLSPEDCQLQSMPDASPVKWHLAHTTWFFETFVLESGAPGYRPFHPQFRVLFNSYYNTVGDQYPRPERGLLSRPSLEEVFAYRAHVDERMQTLLNRELRAEDPAASVIELGLHHEQQHQELILTDVKHGLSCNPLRPAYRDVVSPAAGTAGALRWNNFAAGVYEIGHNGDGFAFDNEGPRHRVALNAFEIASRPVTNAEYVEFIDDGGYRRPELWLSDAWATVQQRRWQAPLYWQPGEHGWDVFTLTGLRAVAPAEPVCHVSLYEADAFARWRGCRLPSEAEWEVAAAPEPVVGNFVEQGVFHPAAAAGAGGLEQIYGDVWEWTQSAYGPYPGYRAVAGALGEYNGKFMCNQMVLRGGSCATPASHMRATYRNFFYPDSRWQFSGIRLARDV